MIVLQVASPILLEEELINSEWLELLGVAGSFVSRSFRGVLISVMCSADLLQTKKHSSNEYVETKLVTYRSFSAQNKID